MVFPGNLVEQTVTIYCPRKEGLLRQEVKAFYHYKDVWTQERFSREFLLVLPEELPLLPGDRVFDGIGPDTVDWESFLPVTVPGLSQVGTVTPYHFRGRFHHLEATH